MLHTLQQHHLRRVLLPLGSLAKSETRRLAREFGLPVAAKPDSQEICFVAGGNYREFLRHHAHALERPGEVVDTDGTVLGQHQGIHHFTVGQRKGLGIAATQPRYVIELRPAENRVVVGSREEAANRRLACSRLSFTGKPPGVRFRAAVKVRYRTTERPGAVQMIGDEADVTLDEPVWGAAPGQLAVFYDGDRVIGGGTIDRLER